MKATRASLAAALLLAAASAFALVQPMRINFQGKLVNPATSNPQAGPVGLTFNVYSVPTGGSAIYTETQAAVPLTNGVFSVQIGTNTAMFRDLFLGASAYLGVTVTGDAAGEMLPRQQLIMSPYAFTANQLSDQNDVRLIAGPTYSTFTSAGNLTVPYGLTAATGAFTDTSFTVGGSSFVVGGGSATVAYGLVAGSLSASTGAFNATGASVYSVTAASGVQINGGTLDVNGGGGITNAYGLTTGSATVTDTSFTVGGSSFIVGGGSVTVAYKLTAAVGAFTAVSATWTVVASSGVQIAGGQLQIGQSTTRTVYDDAANFSTAFSSNVEIVGNVAAANFDWALISSGTLAAAAATLTVNIPSIPITGGTAFSFYRYLIHVPGMAGVGRWELQFNADAANNYAWSETENGVNATGSSVGFIRLSGTSNNFNGSCVLESGAVPNVNKYVTFICTRGTTLATVPLSTTGGGTWAPAAPAAITSITLLNSGAVNFNIGTSIRVFGIR